jgi:hypothetical protein
LPFINHDLSCHHGFVAATCDCVSHLDGPDDAPAVRLHQFVMTQHHGHCTIMPIAFGTQRKAHNLRRLKTSIDVADIDAKN